MVMANEGKKTQLLVRTFQLKTRVLKHTQFITKMAKINTLFMTKMAEKPYPLGQNIPSKN